MSGIRKIETVACPQCGAKGWVGLGMMMLDARHDYRDFTCVACNGTISVRAPRAILDISWVPPAATGSDPRPWLD